MMSASQLNTCTNVVAEIFVITNVGDILFRHKYRNDIKVTPENFTQKIEDSTDVDPIQNLENEWWMQIYESDMYWVAATKNEHNDCVIIDWLENWHNICQDLCGSLSPEAISANILLMVEVALEIAEQGYIQLMKKENIKMLIESEPVVFSKSRTLSSSVGLYVDLVENIEASIETDGTVSKFVVRGHLKLRSTETLTRPVTISLNQPVHEGKQEGFGTGVWVAECNVDPGIDGSSLSTSGSIEAVPREAGSTIFSYALHTPPSQLIPITGNASITPLPNGEMEIEVRLTFMNEVVWLEAEFGVPASTSRLHRASPAWTLDQGAMCLKASIRSTLPSTQQLVLKAVVEGGGTNTADYGPLTIKLEISQFLVSGLKIVRVTPPVKAAKWVRHASVVDCFTIQPSVLPPT